VIALARYEEVADDLRRKIVSGTYPPGSRIPGYTDLATLYGISRGTVRNVLRVLQDEGLVRVVKKAGIIVRTPPERRRIARASLIQRDPKRGYIFPGASRPDEPWCPVGQPRRSFEPVPAHVAEFLGLEPETITLRRRRVMAPEGEPPFDITDTWLHPAAVEEVPRVADPSTGPGGYLDRLEEAGHGPMSWSEHIRARMPTPEEARLLEIPAAGVPVMEMTRVGVSARTGQPLEATVVLSPGDRVELVGNLAREATAAWPTAPVEP
jgi:GntR family transcriptional regulator